jgi:hypothetical protein
MNNAVFIHPPENRLLRVNACTGNRKDNAKENYPTAIVSQHIIPSASKWSLTLRR